ncbi:PREDICTED: uncharacterized protein LOC105363408 [Ceratosolen solmsi marchali]|uniref:Uncharacterized protein LOC105363408 n=1 Tax=Ceratosolen solmsi marchali TaxID=326594 RepID=A0AAJ6YJU6_9HYME|nr:PREDICTED: uncharacterized protein LOC105363408 [Ceratosolen solmsi marchali]
MEGSIDCYFNKLLEGMERNNLASRHRRRQLVKFLSDVIDNSAKVEIVDEIEICERIVRAALRYHNISMTENYSICILGKFHNVLYIAAKLCYDWQVNNNELVINILNDIFYCEKSFERIFIGAILGTRVTHFLSGWKSDFENKEENIKALVYFLDHAIQARLEFYCLSLSSTRRFIDVPMESYGQVVPLHVAVQNASPDILQIMLRYGASIKDDRFIPAPIEVLLARINEYNEEVTCPQQLLICLKLLLRTIPTIIIKIPNHLTDSNNIQNISIYKQYPNLALRKLLPPERLGSVPPELKHLCRCRIRQCLSDNWALPHGIKLLQIPKLLQDYLDLLTD